jgi:hypothetical protein
MILNKSKLRERRIPEVSDTEDGVLLNNGDGRRPRCPISFGKHDPPGREDRSAFLRSLCSLLLKNIQVYERSEFI